MISEISGSLSNSSSGPKPSNSSISTFSSANCSRRFSVTFSSASTSMMIGRNSSESSSLESVAVASGSTRSSRRGSTCSLILWTLASNPPTSELPSLTEVMRSFRRSIASAVVAGRLGLGDWAGAGLAPPPSPGIGGNCSPPRGAALGPPEPFIGRATPKAGRPPGVTPPTLPFLPNALILSPQGSLILRVSRLDHAKAASRGMVNKWERLFFP